MVWIPLGLVGGAGVYSWFWLTDFDRQRKKLPELLDEAKKLGLPLTVEEYGAVLALPAEQNAALIYEEISTRFEKLTADQPEAVNALTSLRVKATDDRLPDSADAAIAMTEEIDVLFQQAAERPGCSSNCLSRSSEVGVFKHFGALRFAFKAGLLRVDRDSLGDDLEAALDRLEWMRRSIVHAFCEPVLMGIVISAALQTLWLDALNRVVKRHHARPGVLDRAECLLSGLPTLPEMRMGLTGEVAYILEYSKSVTPSTIDQHFQKGPPFPLNRSYFRTTRAIEAYVSYGVESLLRRYREMPAGSEDWVAIGKVIQTHRNTRDWWRRPCYAFSTYNHNIAEIIPIRTTRIRLARLGIEIYRVLLNTGSFPPDLPLSGNDVVDARNGDRFKYVVGQHGFSLTANRITY